MKPILCIISADGGNYSVDYAAHDNYTNVHKSGYNPDVFRDVPPGTPLIDYRTADAGKVLSNIMSIDGIQERDQRGIPLAEYIQRMRDAGATVTTAN